MTHTSPATSALWSILSVILFCYLVTHLWKFDRFACVKWNRGNSGAFKRVMTYSYLCSVPLLMVYSITMTVIKYDEGYAVFPGVGIVPKPYQLWTHPQRTWLTAIYIMFATAWALEIVSHLEELCFWLFLINVGAAQTSWFRSIHFKCWVVGSLAAVVGLPVLAVFTRDNPLKCEAWTIFAGSIGSLLITLWFLRVLWLFPAFLRRVKNEGAEPEVVVRLSTFHELNIIRVVFRFMFVLPLMTLAADGIKPSHNHVNESPFWTDLLAMLGAIGCIVSSIITLLIFFPRSIAKEAGYKPRQKTLSQNSRGVHVGSRNNQNQAQQIQSNPTDVKDSGMYDAAPEPTYAVPKQVEDRQVRIGLAPIDRAAATGGGAWEMVDYQQYQQHGVILPTVAPRVGGVMRRQTALHPMVLNYTSPIDLIEGWDESDAFRPTHY
ncbi:transmembrane protein [Ceratobasidium sp. AG-Ba]|nr:transmembrane protein [Ceratobasidium sp. AG-Ba]